MLQRFTDRGIFASMLLLSLLALSVQSQEYGMFETSSDVGEAQHKGSVQFDAAQGRYVVSGGGANMWFDVDAFHFVWKRMSGDFAFSADVKFLDQEGDPHRKACLMVRQTLDADSAYADAALHADGLASLQYREAQGAMTREIQSDQTGPVRIHIERRGDYVSMSVQPQGGVMQPAGGSFRLQLNNPVYVGLAVCSHNNETIARAEFQNVVIEPLAPVDMDKMNLESTLETIAIASKDRRVVHRAEGRFEAPNWSNDNRLYFNQDGRIYHIPVAGGKPEQLNTGFADRCNNDHGISPDGKQFVISDQSQTGRSLIYTLPIEGGDPKQITPAGPSYWHGWSPDGKTLAYCAERNGAYDIYTVPVEGGEETRLTTADGLDDGPDYSPDGKFIYFNSDRTGTMQVWRMKADGSEETQITFDQYNDWFPHPSPDGKWLAFVSFEPDVKGHPADKDVMLRIMPVDGGEVEILAKLFGGQGTINVPSWSPDSRSLAFVSYRWR